MIIRILKPLVALAGIVAVAGCAGSVKPLPDGTVLAQSTVGDTLDRSASFTGRYRPVGTNPDGTTRYQLIAGDLTVGPTVPGQAVIAVAGTVPAALVQRNAAIAAARIKSDAAVAAAEATACPTPTESGGTVICDSVVVGPSTAIADSTSIADTNVDFNATLSGTCPNGRCQGVPMD